jgi:hypothetical protein
MRFASTRSAKSAVVNVKRLPLRIDERNIAAVSR